MRKNFSTPIFFVVAVVIGISVPATAAFAWDAPTHAYEAREILDCRYVCSYNARMGSLAPDFAWYLRDKGLITDQEAIDLHYNFYDLASDKLNWWNFRLRYFVDGAYTHICADPIADDSIAEWLGKFPGGVPEGDEQAFHLAFEFAVGSLLVSQHGLQLWDLLFAYRQAIFVEEVVEDYLGGDLGDFSLEFKRYLALMRALEKAGKLYARYLKGEVGEEFLDAIDMSELLAVEPELSDGPLGLYLKVMGILLAYPDQIRSTITGETGAVSWEDALSEVTTTCIPPGW
jgi:hypothetical protein